MKYFNKLFIFLAIGFLGSTVVNAQDTNQVLNDSLPSIDDEVYLPFNTINEGDSKATISVLNPDEYIDSDYNLSAAGGVRGRVSGLLGVNNIWGMGNALIMIDGVPRSINDVTLSEIEQISVIKGVNAVALYGSHAAKGVVMIKTKRGGAYKQKVTLRVNSGYSTPKSLPNYLGSSDYMTLFNEARTNDGLSESFDSNTIDNFKNGNSYIYPSVDYYSKKYISDFTYSNDANMAISGGNKDASYFANIGLFNNSTLLNFGEGDDEGDQKFNLRGNIDFKLSDIISTSIDVSAIYFDRRRGNANYWSDVASITPDKYSPLIPLSLLDNDSESIQEILKNSDNIIDGQYLLGGTQEYLTNPIATTYAGGYNEYTSRTLQISNNINVDLGGILDGLTFKTKFSFDYLNSYTKTINNSYATYVPTWDGLSESITNLDKLGEDTTTGAQALGNSATRRNIGVSSQLNYNNTFKENHNVSAMLLGSITSISSNNSYQPTRNTNLGIQLGYNYLHKYYVDFSGAVVNSTKLPEGNRVGFSPSIGLGWVMSSEDFLSNSKAIDYLKLSVEAGSLNTDLDINDYYLYDAIYSRQAYFSWNDGVYTNQATTAVNGYNPNLFYAKRNEANLSLEGVFFNKSLSAKASVFYSKMDDIVTQDFNEYPSFFSSFVPYSNYNSDLRKGIDLMVNVNKNAGEFNFNLGLNATYLKTEVLERSELYQDEYQNRVGKSIGAIFGLVSNGFFDDAQDIASSPVQDFGTVLPGDIKYVDQNGDNVINERDAVEIGKWASPLSFGINLTTTYKNFTLFLQGTGSVGGNSVTTNDYYWVDGNDKYSDVVLGRWTPSTKATATYPRLTTESSSNNFRYSDFWLYDTDRFDISRVQLSYNVPLKNSKWFKDLNIFINGSSLYTFSKNRDRLNLNIASSPQMRNYTIGLKFKF